MSSPGSLPVPWPSRLACLNPLGAVEGNTAWELAAALPEDLRQIRRLAQRRRAGGPLGLGWQPPWSGENAVMAVLDKRASSPNVAWNPTHCIHFGPALNGVFITRIQLGVGGNFRSTRWWITRFAQGDFTMHLRTCATSLIVPLDSPLKSVKDLRGGKNGEPYVIGIALPTRPPSSISR